MDAPLQKRDIAWDRQRMRLDARWVGQPQWRALGDSRVVDVRAVWRRMRRDVSMISVRPCGSPAGPRCKCAGGSIGTTTMPTIANSIAARRTLALIEVSPSYSDGHQQGAAPSARHRRNARHGRPTRSSPRAQLSWPPFAPPPEERLWLSLTIGRGPLLSLPQHPWEDDQEEKCQPRRDNPHVDRGVPVRLVFPRARLSAEQATDFHRASSRIRAAIDRSPHTTDRVRTPFSVNGLQLVTNGWTSDGAADPLVRASRFFEHLGQPFMRSRSSLTERDRYSQPPTSCGDPSCLGEHAHE